jgi:hypothetical protein
MRFVHAGAATNFFLKIRIRDRKEFRFRGMPDAVWRGKKRNSKESNSQTFEITRFGRIKVGTTGNPKPIAPLKTKGFFSRAMPDWRQSADIRGLFRPVPVSLRHPFPRIVLSHPCAQSPSSSPSALA